MDKVFVTFNKSSIAGENTALRMQTLSNLYGFNVLLPYRLGLNFLSEESKRRIQESSFVLAFAFGRMSKILREELEYAISLNKPVIIVYDNINKNKRILNGQSNQVIEIVMDYYNQDVILHKISEFLSRELKSKNKDNKKESAVGTAIVALGLSLLAYWFLSKK